MRSIGTFNQRAILSPPNLVTQVVLASSVAQAFDVPTGAMYAQISMDLNCYAKYGSASALNPTTSSSAGSSSCEQLLASNGPHLRNLSSTLACTGLSLISTGAAVGSISWYAP